MPPSARVLVAILSLACVHCVLDSDDEERHCDDGPAEIGIHNAARDAGWTPWLEDGWFAGPDGTRQACPSTPWGIRCTVPHSGVYTFCARSDDRELSTQSEVTRDDFCAPGPEVGLDDPCVPEQTETVSGSLLWRDGEPVAQLDDVEVWMEIREHRTTFPRECERSADRFHCFAVNGSATDYTIHARIGSSLLTQEVQVPFVQCQVPAPVELRFDREGWACAEPRKMELSLGVRVPDPAAPDGIRSVQPDAVELRDASGQVWPCTLMPTTIWYEPNVLCPVLERPRDGIYWADVTFGDRIETLEFYVSDDGCKFQLQWDTLWLYDGRTCTGSDGEHCGAPGSVFPSYSRCPNYIRYPHEPHLPACVRPPSVER